MYSVDARWRRVEMSDEDEISRRPDTEGPKYIFTLTADASRVQTAGSSGVKGRKP